MQITHYYCDVTDCLEETGVRDSMPNFTGNVVFFNNANRAKLELNGNEICPYCVDKVNGPYHRLKPFLVDDGLGNMSINPIYKGSAR